MLDLDILKAVLKIRVTTDMLQSRFYQYTLKIERFIFTALAGCKVEEEEGKLKEGSNYEVFWQKKRN